jgi:hypothetical protein
MSPNPFSGSEPPPRYTPKTVVDPQTGIVWKLSEGGYGWEQAGEAIPNPKEHMPPAAQPVPAAFVQHVKSLGQFAPDTIKMASAIQVAISNTNYNAQLYERYVDAWLAWAQGGRQTKEPPSPKPYYRLADFSTVLSLIMNDVDTSLLLPPEINYNQ